MVRRDTAMIDSVPSCSTCSLTVTDSLLIGTAKDASIPVRVPGFLKDSRGTNYLTFEGWGSQPVLSYDSLGRYQGEIGHYGQGPGEYRHTSVVRTGNSDSLFVFEGYHLGHVFSADGKYARRADVGGKRPFAVATDSTGYVLAISTQTWPPTTGNQYVFRFGAEARLVDSFPVFSVSTGRTKQLSSGKESYSKADMLLSEGYAGPSGTVWTMGPTNYRLEQHDRRGISRKLFGVRVAGEAPPIMNEAEMREAQATQRMVPTYEVISSPRRVKALWPKRWLDVDQDGLLWVGRQIAAPGWDTINTKAQKLSPNEAPNEETIPREIDDRRYHTVLEVIDPHVGQMLARIELPFLGERVSAGFVGRVVADADGFLKPSVYKLQLKR